MKFLVLCAGGHAKVVIEALRSSGHDVLGLIDQDPGRLGTRVGGCEVLGPDETVLRYTPGDVSLANGLGNRSRKDAAGLQPRIDLYERFSRLGFRFPPIRHASAIVASDAVLGEGAHVMAGAVIQASATVGCNVIVNSRALVEHDCKVGDHTHVAPGAILCGGVTIGARAHIGSGAIVLQNVTVPDDAVIPAGDVVRRPRSD